MTQVFISYSRKDLAFVEQLAADLKAAGLNVWYDLSRLEAGDTWPEEIQFAIDASNIFVIVISPDSIVSRWVRKEFLYASSNNKKIVPLFYRNCKLPLWLQDIHFIDVQVKNYDLNYEEILHTLGVKSAVLEKSPVPEIEELISVKLETKEEVPKLRKVPKKRIWRWLATMILVALFGIILVTAFVLPKLFSQLEDIPKLAMTSTDEIRQEITSETATIDNATATTESRSTLVEAIPTTSMNILQVSNIGLPEHPIKLLFVPSADATVIINGGVVLANYLHETTGLNFEVSIPTSFNATLEEMCASSNDTIGFIPSLEKFESRPCEVDVAFVGIRAGKNLPEETISFGLEFPIEMRTEIESALISFAKSTAWRNSIGREDFYNWENITLVP